MTTYTHQTAPTQFVEANGIRFAYRRFGNPRGVPLVFSPHYTGTMDYWDPAVTDGLAKNREVILFNNAGVSSSSGQVPASVQEMGANAIAFIKALGLTKVDVLGFSIGGNCAAGARSEFLPSGNGRKNDAAEKTSRVGNAAPKLVSSFVSAWRMPRHWPA